MRDTMIECISLMLLRVQAAFRADEAAEVGLERVKRYLIPRSLTADERQQAERALADIVATCGPVVGGYPSWHPLVAKSLKASDQVTIPSERCGYRGLDHTVYFAHGFVTSPYGDGEEVVRSANNIVGPKNIYV